MNLLVVLMQYPGDSVVTGRGQINGRLAYVFSQVWVCLFFFKWPLKWVHNNSVWPCSHVPVYLLPVSTRQTYLGRKQGTFRQEAKNYFFRVSVSRYSCARVRWKRVKNQWEYFDKTNSYYFIVVSLGIDMLIGKRRGAQNYVFLTKRWINGELAEHYVFKAAASFDSVPAVEDVWMNPYKCLVTRKCPWRALWTLRTIFWLSGCRMWVVCWRCQLEFPEVEFMTEGTWATLNCFSSLNSLLS